MSALVLVVITSSGVNKTIGLKTKTTTVSQPSEIAKKMFNYDE